MNWELNFCETLNISTKSIQWTSTYIVWVAHVPRTNQSWYTCLVIPVHFTFDQNELKWQHRLNNLSKSLIDSGPSVDNHQNRLCVNRMENGLCPADTFPGWESTFGIPIDTCGLSLPMLFDRNRLHRCVAMGKIGLQWISSFSSEEVGNSVSAHKYFIYIILYQFMARFTIHSRMNRS